MDKREDESHHESISEGETSGSVDSIGGSVMCTVCSRIPARNNYGGLCCSSCKIFFLRAATKGYQPSCHEVNRCLFNSNKCKGCRYAKCLQVGMVPEMTGRREGCYRRRRAEEKFQKQGKKVYWRANTRIQSVRGDSVESSSSSISSLILAKDEISSNRFHESKLIDSVLSELRAVEILSLNEEQPCCSNDFFDFEYNLDLNFEEVMVEPKRLCQRIPMGFMNAKRLKDKAPPDIMARGCARFMLYMADWMRNIKEISDISLQFRSKFCMSRISSLVPLVISFYTHKWGYSSLACGLGLLVDRESFASFDSKFLDRANGLIFEHVIETLREVDFGDDEFVLLKNVVFFTHSHGLPEEDSRIVRQSRNKYAQLLAQLICAKSPNDLTAQRRIVKIFGLCSIFMNFGSLCKAFLTLCLLKNIHGLTGKLITELNFA